MKDKITKNTLISLLDEVLIPLENEINQDEDLQYLFEKDENILKKFNFLKLASVLLKGEIPMDELINEFMNNCEKLGVSKEKMIEYMKIFKSLYIKWAKKELEDKKRIEKSLNELIETFKELKDNNEYDDFFDFDSEEVDDRINNMHYADKDKISANEFMQANNIDEDMINELYISLRELKNSIVFNINLTKEYLNNYVISLNQLKNILIFEPEFKGLTFVINDLVNKLEYLDIDSLNEEQSKIIKNMLDAIYEDIQKWFNEVLIEQTAVDINYLDASLLASISQIDIMINLKDR